MKKPIRVGDEYPSGCVDRIIQLFWGTRRASHNTSSIEYECLFRINGEWYDYYECDGPNGGCMTSLLSSVTDSNVEAYAEEQKAKWQKITGQT